MKNPFRRAIALAALAALALGASVNAQAAPILFDFSSVTGATFRFDGASNSFSFPNGVGAIDFLVTLQNANWPGSVLNYTGDFIAPVGGWTVGNVGNPTSVAGIGTLVLRNAAATSTLTGDLTWSTIGTLGVGGVINVFGVLNYTNLVQVGADANLAALASIGSASITVTFQGLSIAPGTAAPGEDCSALLGQLRCGGISTSSYSGSLIAETVVPVPAAAWLFVGGIGALGALRRRQLAA